MFLYLGKLIGTLATTLGIVAAVLIWAAISLRRASRPFLHGAVIFAAAVLLFCSSGCGSHLMLHALEQPYAGGNVATAPAAGAIVVLGGYLRIATRIPRQVEIGGASDRLLCAAELYRAGKAPLILLTGGNVTFFPLPGSNARGAIPEAAAAARILQEWGIPESAILIEDKSRSTRENGAFSRRILADRNIDRILLVTSAFHMRRALGVFRKTGLNVIPFAADFFTESELPDVALSLLPDAGALADSSIAIKEWIGFMAYRARGWTD